MDKFRCISDIEKVISDMVVMLRIRNITEERSVKFGNRNVITFHCDGFDKNKEGLRITFFDQMAKRWGDLLEVS